MARVRECAAILALTGCLAASVAGRQVPPFHAETRLVVLHVLVTNGRGEVVTDLDRRAFSVYEDGRRESIALFHRDDVPISLGLIIDNSGSMRALRPSVEAAALAFVHASNPNDEIFVVNFADTPRIDVPFTNDVHVLENGIARVDSIGGTALRDAILLGERYVQDHASQDRRALLVITDGNDNASTVTTAQARRVIERSRSVLYAIRLVREGVPADDRPGSELDRLVELTGGSVRHPASVSDLDRVIMEIAHQMRNEYTIAYTPANPALDGKYRAVRVIVAGRGGMNVRTRPGYWATPPQGR